MSQKKLSLQEQLLKSGLTTDAKAKQVRSDKHKQAKQHRKNNIELDDEAKRLVQQAKAQQAEKDRELSQLIKAQAEQKELAAQVRQLIELNRRPQDDESLAYHFTDQGKVKSVYVSEALREQIGKGYMAIVKGDKCYEIVAAAVAEKIKSRQADCVMVFNDPNKMPEATDDPYAAYQVPDDLMW
jgi:uncharacterized protein YaiL (DUF2058 family)